MPIAIAIAASFGHVFDQSRRPRPGPSSTPRSRTSSPANVDSRSCAAAIAAVPVWLMSASAGMAADLLAQEVGDLAGELADGRRIDAPRPLDVDVDARRDAARAARQDDDPVG